MATQLIYGDASINPEKITGLTPRFNSLTAENGDNIIDAGGTGSTNTSIWLVAWDDTTAHGIYPRGSVGGLKPGENKEDTLFDATGGRYEGYRTHYKWDAGLVIRDWRFVVRIANIDVSDLTGQTGTQAITAATWLNKLMIKALARIPSMGMGTPMFLASRTVKEMLSIGALDKSQNALSFTDAVNQYGSVGPGSVAGQGTGIQGGTLRFMGVPVVTVDQLLATEARVV